MDDGKRELVREWLLKASHDLIAARILAQSPKLSGRCHFITASKLPRKHLRGS